MPVALAVVLVRHRRRQGVRRTVHDILHCIDWLCVRSVSGRNIVYNRPCRTVCCPSRVDVLLLFVRRVVARRPEGPTTAPDGGPNGHLPEQCGNRACSAIRNNQCLSPGVKVGPIEGAPVRYWGPRCGRGPGMVLSAAACSARCCNVFVPCCRRSGIMRWITK